jgi:lipopolysaccharide biosynthesis glycosyltransferase
MLKNSLGLITHCDINYLSRALALVQSLRTQGETTTIHILCHDVLSFEKLNQLEVDGVHAISRKEMFDDFPELATAEGTRSPIEYFYLFSPYLLKYLQKRGYENLVYLDSDLYFFGSLDSVLSLAPHCEIGLVPHRFEAQDAHLNKYGIYNVGLVYFKNCSSALRTLDWWAKACLVSTKFEVTEKSFGDQKYLEFFKEQDVKIFEFESHGHNAAPWNCHSADFDNSRKITIKGEKLFYYHFSGLRIYRFFATLGFTSFRKKPNQLMRQVVYKPYIRDVIFWESVLGNSNRIDSRKVGFRDILNAIKYRDLMIL